MRGGLGGQTWRSREQPCGLWGRHRLHSGRGGSADPPALVCGFRVHQELSRGSVGPALAGPAPPGSHGLLESFGSVCSGTVPVGANVFSLAGGFVTIHKMKVLIGVNICQEIWQFRFRVGEQVLSCKLLLRTRLAFCLKNFFLGMIVKRKNKTKQKTCPAISLSKSLKGRCSFARCFQSW